MKRLPWTILGLFATAAAINLAFVGCGSESDPPADTTDASGEGSTNETGPNPPTDSGGDGFISTIDGGRADAADCKLEATACTSSTECCTANCDPATKACAKPVNACTASGQACAAGPECCTSSCIGGKCASKQCVADNQACGVNEECCGGTCAPDGLGGGKCAPLNPGGPASSGNPCATGADCASKYCNNGICTNVSFCAQTGDVCADNNDCCGGACTKAAGATLGKCGLTPATGAGGCDQAGTVCPSQNGACGGNCCSRSCAPYGATQTSVCQPASGCKPTGDLCRGDSDCCGWSGSPDPKKGPVTCRKNDSTQEFGLCDKGTACNEPGAICGQPFVCNAENACCDPVGEGANFCQNDPSKCCARDALGVPRCTVKPVDCTNAPPAAGSVCATSADCCGKPCVDNKCGGACVPAAGGCTVNADCCAGQPCAIPVGSTKGVCGGTVLADGGVSTEGGVAPVQDGGTAGDGGVCALYGQECTSGSTTECCSNVPCTGVAGSSTCRYP